MSNSMLVSITIGAALSSGFRTAMGGAEKTLDQLGKTTADLTAKQRLLGKAIKDGLFVRKNVDGLKDQYQKLGAAIERAVSSHRRLNALMERGAALKDARGQLRGEMMDAGATAVAVGAPALKSVRLAGGFEDILRDIAITGEMTKAEESRLGAVIRKDAIRFNQTQEALAAGVGVLVAGGIQSADELTKFSPVLAKAATATRADVGELGAVFLSMRNNLHIAAEDSESALNMLAFAGKKGQVEIRDMAKFMPQIAPMMEGLGVTGKEAVAEIGAALQVARKGAGTNDEAATNLRNFLTKVSSPDTVKDFAKAGIDLKGSLIALRAQGLTPMQGMMQLITDYMGTKGPQAAGDLKQAIELKDESERQAALSRLGEAYKLGELFQDMQAMNFIRPALANAKELGEIKQGALAAGNTDLLGVDYAKRMEGFNEQWKAFVIQAKDLGITVGNALLPPLSALLKTAAPVAAFFNKAAGAFPRLTAAVIGLAMGLTLGKVAFIACGFAANVLRSALVGGQVVAALASGKLAALRGALLLVSGAARTMSLSLLANPIGAIIAAIAVGALLIYKYWGPISGFFKGLWRGIKDGLKEMAPALAAFFGKIGAFIAPALGPIKWLGGAIKGIGRWLLDLLKPVDDVGGAAEAMGVRVGKALAGILKDAMALPGKMYTAGANIIKSLWEGMKSIFQALPGQFKEWGGQLLTGLIAGIKAKAGAVKDAIVGVGAEISNSFKSALGIQSPSKVFRGFGLNIGEGTRQGILGGVPGVQSAGKKLTAAALAGAVAVGGGAVGASGQQQARGLQMGHITYAPVIHVSATDPAGTRQQVDQALRLSQAEFEKMLARAGQNKARKGFV